MCGITLLYEYYKRKFDISKISSLQKHRGGDHQGVHIGKQYAIGHERLSVEDLSAHGHQPFFSANKKQILIHNGEIYNHDLLREKYKLKCQSLSDSEIILRLYEEFNGDIEAVLELLDGMFAFAIVDEERKRFIIARDRFGIKPLSYFACSKGFGAASELKVVASISEGKPVKIFPPGMYVDIDMSAPLPVTKTGLFSNFKQYYSPSWYNGHRIRRYHGEEVVKVSLRTLLIEAVHKRIPKIPFGVMLSGGLDSSLIAGIACHLTKNTIPTFSVGIAKEIDGKLVPMSQDILNARQVAAHLGTNHYERLFTVEEGIAALQTVIYAVESFDVTTIRGATPMMFLAELARKHVRTVLSGEGADEVFCGYSYFTQAENALELQLESIQKVKSLHLTDNQRVDRTTSFKTLECRVPFMDTDLVDYAMTHIDPELKLTKENRIEKFILRAAFDGDSFISRDVLLRSKLQLSDGVGYTWIDEVKKYADRVVTDEEFENAVHRWPIDTPLTKEAYLYRDIFADLFPKQDHMPHVWKTFSHVVDPSGRFQTSELIAAKKSCNTPTISPLL